MSVFFLFGKYTPESTKNIDPARTQQAVGIIEKHDGQITAMYGLLGEHDLVFIVNLPGNQQAMQVAIELTRLTGISFTTAPAVNVQDFDNLITGKHFVEGLDDLDLDEDV